MSRIIYYCGGCNMEYWPEDGGCPRCDKNQKSYEQTILDRAIDSQGQRVNYLNSKYGENGTGKNNSRRKKREVAAYILRVLEDAKR